MSRLGRDETAGDDSTGETAAVEGNAESFHDNGARCTHVSVCRVRPRRNLSETYVIYIHQPPVGKYI